MDAAKRQALEAAGWKCGDAEDFLGTNETGVEQMSESKHTPGSWAPCNTTIYSVDDAEPVARCLDKEIHRAFRDAHLIAAAPDMLQALEVALKDMVHWGIFGPGRNAVEAAIKKAKGE